jgi:hypothetical protein
MTMSNCDGPVERLPSQVLFQVGLMRTMMKTIETAPLHEVVIVHQRLNEQLDLLQENAEKAARGLVAEKVDIRAASGFVTSPVK